MFLSGTHSELASQIEAIGTPVSIWERAKNGKFNFVSGNTLFQQIVDSEVSSLIGHDVNAVIPRYIVKDVKEALITCVKDQKSIENEIVIERHGRPRWWRFNYSPLVSRNGEVVRVLSTSIEITEKKELEKSLETSMKRFEAVINSAYDGIITIDNDQNIKMFNQAAGEMFDIAHQDAVGMPLVNLLPGRFRHKHNDYVAGFNESPVMSRPMHTRASVMGLRQDGTEFPLEVTISKIRVGQTTEMTAVLRDISERARLIEELRAAAATDPLTGINNRRSFEKQLEAESARCIRFDHTMAIVMFDLDKFKRVNDQFGHTYGDTVLLSVVKQVQSQIRDVDVFARWGGDEFVVLLPETGLDGALAWAEKTRSLVEQQQKNENHAGLTLSMGVTIFGGEKDYAQLLATVDQLLFSAKAEGRNRIKHE